MTKDYIMENIRSLLTYGFDVAELRRFCNDDSRFEPVYHKTSSSTNISEMVDYLLDYTEQKLLQGDLLQWAKKNNLARYKKHGPYYRDSTQSTSSYQESEPSTIESKPQSKLVIQDKVGILLPNNATTIFEQMFNDHKRLRIVKEFGAGLSDSRVFLVQPTKITGLRELQTVIKIASDDLIKKERKKNPYSLRV